MRCLFPARFPSALARLTHPLCPTPSQTQLNVLITVNRFSYSIRTLRAEFLLHGFAPLLLDLCSSHYLRIRQNAAATFLQMVCTHTHTHTYTHTHTCH